MVRGFNGLCDFSKEKQVALISGKRKKKGFFLKIWFVGEDDKDAIKLPLSIGFEERFLSYKFIVHDFIL